MKRERRPSVVLHMDEKIRAFQMERGHLPQAILLGRSSYQRFQAEASTMLVKSDGSPIEDEAVGRFQGVNLYVARDIDIMVECVWFG